MPRKNPAVMRLQKENQELRNVIESQQQAIRGGHRKVELLEDQIDRLITVLEEVAKRI